MVMRKKLKSAAALFLFLLSVSQVNAQAVYSNFKEGPKLDRFTEVSENLRCLCGCGLVLASCPHVDCGWGIPARRFIEYMIEQGFSNIEILTMFDKGTMRTEGQKHYAEHDNAFLKQYFADETFHTTSDFEGRRQRLQRFLADLPVAEQPAANKAATKEAALKEYIDAKIRHYRAVIKKSDAETAEIKSVGQLDDAARIRLSQLEEDSGLAYGRILRMASFRVGFGPRVYANKLPLATIILSIIGCLGLTAIIVVILKRKGNNRTADSASSASPEPTSVKQDEDDLERYFK